MDKYQVTEIPLEVIVERALHQDNRKERHFYSRYDIVRTADKKPQLLITMMKSPQQRNKAMLKRLYHYESHSFVIDAKFFDVARNA
jgi:hypothetical protein